MDKYKQQIRSLIRAVYLMNTLLFLCLLVLIAYYFFPLTTIPIPAEERPGPWSPRSIVSDIPEGPQGDMILYGYQLITETPRLIGPGSDKSELRYSGNNLTCNNCHLNAGRKIGSGSFIGVTNRYPQFRGRENRIGTIEDRINGCMERSMNGFVMPVDGREMQALVAYMEWLSEGVPESIEKIYKGYVSIQLPEVAADTSRGRILYEAKCTHCHMKDGRGKLKPGSSFEYDYPPLSGPDTYNDGAGMNRVITSAEFIKGNMPFGATHDAPKVTDEEAYHLAAYINSFPRPVKSEREKDFPDIKLKPVSTPYGPWADDFPPEQHKYGPFQPIMAFYKAEYDLEKKK